MDGGEGGLSLRILLRDPSGSPLSSGLAQNARPARFVEPSSRVLIPLFFHAQKSAQWAPFFLRIPFAVLVSSTLETFSGLRLSTGQLW